MSIAAVIGAGTAGLLASQVLSKYYDRVYLIERDNILNQDVKRTGIPQQAHIHTLLLRGLQILESYYPEIQTDMDKLNCPRIHWAEDLHVQTTGGVGVRHDLGFETRGISRFALDKLMRTYALRTENIIPIVDTRVTGLIWENNEIRGVYFEEGMNGGKKSLEADLVIVASGRNTPVEQWLQEGNYKVPQPTILNSHLGYASRRYKIPSHIHLDSKLIAIQPRPQQKFYRGAGATQIEDSEVIVTLVGVNSDYPPTTNENAYLDFARSLYDAKTSEWIEQLEPISPIAGCRPISILQHYNQMPNYPDNLLILGDAFCSLNPFYGQGMTIAAITASLLDRMLSRADLANLRGFSHRFQNRLAKTVSFPWRVGVGEDLRYPLTEGVDQNLTYKLAQYGTDFLLKAVAQDVNVGERFIRVMHMLDSPFMLLDPMYGFYCLRYWLRSLSNSVQD